MVFILSLTVLNLSPGASVPARWDPCPCCCPEATSAPLAPLAVTKGVLWCTRSPEHHTPKVFAGEGMLAAHTHLQPGGISHCKDRESPKLLQDAAGEPRAAALGQGIAQALGAGIAPLKSPGTYTESTGFSYSAAFLGNHLPPDLA